MAEHQFRRREDRRFTETYTTSERISDFGETPSKRFAADHQENTDSPCLTTSGVASLRGHTKRCAFRYARGWRVVPAAPPRPPLFLRPLIAFGLAPAWRLLPEACHG